MVELAAGYSTQPNETSGALSRWQAAGIHLGISAVIAALVIAAVYLVW